MRSRCFASSGGSCGDYSTVQRSPSVAAPSQKRVKRALRRCKHLIAVDIGTIGKIDLSFLHVSRPEIDLPDGTDIYSDQVYRKAVDNYQHLIETAPLEREAEPSL